MADFTSSPMAGGYGADADDSFSVTTPSNRLTTLTNVAGAAVSLALIVGIGVWGYKLLVRDVSGIPVVRAAQGEMRVRPEEPGGKLAQHQGLSVNVIAAHGTSGKPADELRLAPRPTELTEDDQVTTVAMVAPAPQDAVPENLPNAEIADVAAALQSGNVDDLVAQLTEGVAPLTEMAADPEEVVATVAAEVAEAVAITQPASIDAPGVRQSLRPKRRPAAAARATVVQASLDTSATAPKTKEVDASSLPAGTRLAQLGAFDSPEVAREQWDVLQRRFDAFLGDKQRIVQKATSGGRVFYRLRAMGFQDIADARRFCAALVAENADCIPVVTR
ncbi:MAG: SPOR domain-containing protein [Sulfitobacter sp.]